MLERSEDLQISSKVVGECNTWIVFVLVYAIDASIYIHGISRFRAIRSDLRLDWWSALTARTIE